MDQLALSSIKLSLSLVSDLPMIPQFNGDRQGYWISEADYQTKSELVDLCILLSGQLQLYAEIEEKGGGAPGPRGDFSETLDSITNMITTLSKY